MSNTNSISVKECIKAAVRKVFHREGCAATRTHDIAEEVGISHAILSHYFRSRKKLFQVVTTEAMTRFPRGVGVTLDDETISLDGKIGRVVANYIDLLLEEPDLPTFILNEVRPNPQFFVEQSPIGEALTHSMLARQYTGAVVQGRITESSPMHAVLGVIGLVISPFVTKSILSAITNLPEERYGTLMLQHKTLIPQWTKAILSLLKTGD